MSLAEANAAGVQIAIDFLKVLRPKGPWALWAKHPDTNKVGTVYCFTTNLAEAKTWIEERQETGYNLYTHVNLVESPPERGKAVKSDIKAVEYFHVDVDPPRDLRGDDPQYAKARAEILEKLKAHNPVPTFIVDSGNGYNAYWKLETPIEDIEQAECYNIGLAKLLGGDNCHNADRVLRLPGTLNVPTETKAKRGCRIVRSTIVHQLDEKYEAKQFPFASKEEQQNTASGKTFHYSLPASADGSEPHLDSLLPDTDHIKVKGIIFAGDNEDYPYSDRSKLVFWVACEMVRLRVPSINIAHLLMWKRPMGVSKISDHIYAQAHPRAYVARQIERATSFVSLDSENYEVIEDDKKNKKITPTERNVQLWLHKNGIELERDVWSERVRVRGSPRHTELDDYAMRSLWLDIKKMRSPYSFPIGKDLCYDFFYNIADQNRVNPVMLYLENLIWDGTARVENWLVTYAGVEDSPYVRAVGGLVLEAAARRVLEPGCKFDEMLVLESKEGYDKSTMLSTLAVKEDWFTDHVPLGDEAQKVLEAVEGHWIIEVGELGFKRNEVERVKAQLSARADKARKAYAHSPTTRYRQCVFIGTTNLDDYLQGSTGNRRFWPVAVTKPCDVKAVKRDRGQLWAEAVLLAKDRIRTDRDTRLDPSLYEAARVEQEKRTERDAWMDFFAPILEGLEGRVTTSDLWAVMGVEPKDRGQYNHSVRLVSTMKRLGWLRNNSGTISVGGANVSGWRKGTITKLITLEDLIRAKNGRGLEVKSPFE